MNLLRRRSTLPPLPDDVICEILSWVPVKSACRFRCVSQGWDALISGPAFVAAHRVRARPLLLFAVNSPYKIASDLRLMDMNGNLVKLIKRPGVCNFNRRLDGPICVTEDFIRPTIAVNVIDLATGTTVTISKELKKGSFLDLNIGCATSSRTYKIVCLTSKYDAQSCKVLTIEDGAKWRQLPSPPAELVTIRRFNNHHAITVNGVMHHLYEFLTWRMDLEDLLVLRFDLQSEEWRTSIKAPGRIGDNLQEKTWTTHMGKLNDALCLVQRSSINTWYIWLLTDPAKGTWVKTYTIPMTLPIDWLMPLTVMLDDRKLLFYMYDRSSRTSAMQVYDPLTKKCTQHLKFADNHLSPHLCDLHLECFVSTKILPVAACPD